MASHTSPPLLTPRNTMAIMKADIVTLWKPVSLFFTKLLFLVHFGRFEFSAAIYLINRMSKTTLSSLSSYEKLFKHSFDPTKFRVFGCPCYHWLRPYPEHKLDPKSRPCLFLRYSLTQSAFLCFNVVLNKRFVSRHVQLIENQFLFRSIASFVSSPFETQLPLAC